MKVRCGLFHLAADLVDVVHVAKLCGFSPGLWFGEFGLCRVEDAGFGRASGERACVGFCIEDAVDGSNSKILEVYSRDVIRQCS